MADDTQHIREELEVDRLTTELASRFEHLAPDTIADGLRGEFEKRASYPVQDFVPIFVERSVRARLGSA